MITGNATMNTRGRNRPLWAMVHTVLLISAVFIGLFSMHVISHPAKTLDVVSHTPAHMVGDTQTPLFQGYGSNHHDKNDCATCPSGHDMVAASCILALFVLLLLVKMPRVVTIAKIAFRLFNELGVGARGPCLNKPDLTALGICRT